MNYFLKDSMLRKVDSCNFNLDDLTGGLNNYGATSLWRQKQKDSALILDLIKLHYSC